MDMRYIKQKDNENMPVTVTKPKYKQGKQIVLSILCELLSQKQIFTMQERKFIGKHSKCLEKTLR